MGRVHSALSGSIPTAQAVAVSPHQQRKEGQHESPAQSGSPESGLFRAAPGHQAGGKLSRGVAYHGTPITPRLVLEAMGARDYCVSYFRPDDVEWIDANARSWFADNGVFSFWMTALKTGGEVVMTREYLDGYYAFVRRWALEGSGACKWAVIPDPIGTGTQELDALLREWPADLADHGVPVWHLDEPIDRALTLLDRYGRCCFGATGEYRVILSDAFCERMDEVFDAIQAHFNRIPPIHFFRGLQLLKPECPWPIATADSTDRARNHNRLKVLGDHYLWAVKQSADRWDHMAARRSFTWPANGHQHQLFGAAA